MSENKNIFPTSFKMEGKIKKRWEKYQKEKGRSAPRLAGILNEGVDIFLKKEGY